MYAAAWGKSWHSPEIDFSYNTNPSEKHTPPRPRETNIVPGELSPRKQQEISFGFNQAQVFVCC